MKKSLVALAALAATTAFAQSSVTLYGNLDQTLYHATNDGKSVNYSNSNGGTTSLWGITGTEDLGGGIKATFDLKSELTLATGQIGSGSTAVNTAAADTAATTGTIAGALSTSTNDNRVSGAFNRGAWVGLNTNMGNVKLGRQNDALWEQAGRFNNTGINSFGWNNLTAAATGFSSSASSFNGTTLTGSTMGAVSSTNYNPSGSGAALPFYAALSYETPAFNGFKAKVMSSPKGSYNQSAGDWKRSAMSLTYDNGPIAAAYGQSYINGSDGGTAAKVTLVAGSYTVGALKFNVGQQKTTFSGVFAATGHDLTVTGFGLTYTQGKWEYNAGYTTLKDDEDSAYKTTQTGLTARYNFSKRTSVYGGYGAGKNEGASNKQGIVYAGDALAAGNTTNNAILVGIKHAF